MLADQRVRSLATEFACHWLDVHDFDKLDEKSEQHFPAFKSLRGDMYEESIRFFADLVPARRLGVGDARFGSHVLEQALAEFYGIPAVTGPEWRRVDGVRQYGRGGILGLSTTLAKNSGASRTSPILRGNWLLEMMLGEKLPKPPKNVPILPEDETATEGLTVRQLVEKHRSAAQCCGVPCQARPVRLRARGLRRHRPQARQGPGRPADRHGGRPARRHACRRTGRVAQLPGHPGARTSSCAISAASC